MVPLNTANILPIISYRRSLAASNCFYILYVLDRMQDYLFISCGLFKGGVYTGDVLLIAGSYLYIL